MKPPYVLPIVADIVRSGISAVEGITFTGHSVCPVCGGDLTGYDTKRKQFAHLITKNGLETMYVDIRRFRCRTCRQICYADEPFYPDTRIGSVIIDLCIAFSMTMPVYRVPAYLAAMGIHVDRSSCRLYVRHISGCYVRTNTRYIDENGTSGIHLPLSVLTLSSLAITHPEGSGLSESEVISACGSPSAPRKAKNFPLPLKRWVNRDNLW